jgi:hypothetical protein
MRLGIKTASEFIPSRLLMVSSLWLQALSSFGPRWFPIARRIDIPFVPSRCHLRLAFQKTGCLGPNKESASLSWSDALLGQAPVFDDGYSEIARW